MSVKPTYAEAMEIIKDPTITEYTCMSAECERQGGVIIELSDRSHGHGCPDEGDICTAALCNMLGRCEA